MIREHFDYISSCNLMLISCAIFVADVSGKSPKRRLEPVDTECKSNVLSLYDHRETLRPLENAS